MENSHLLTFTETIAVKCKYCGSENIIRYGKQGNVQQYYCNDCNRKFGDKDTPEKKETPYPEIATALGLFFDGMSLTNISEQLKHIYSDDVNPSTIYRWVIEYSEKATRILDLYPPELGKIWIVDETVIDIAGRFCCKEVDGGII